MNFKLLGFILEGAYAKALPMGRCICFAGFECFSTFGEWCLRVKSGMTNVSHYLDYFLFVVRKDSDKHQDLLSHFFELTAELGVLLSSENKEGPSLVLSFLSVEMDTLRLSKLPMGKLDELQRRLGIFLCRNKATWNDFQVLLGHLNFTCKVVASSRTFSAPLYAATSKVSASHRFIRVTKELKEDFLARPSLPTGRIRRTF